MSGSSTGAGQQQQQQQQRPASGNKRTGRPKRLQPPPRSFHSLPSSAQPQPVELACLVYQYLLPLYPNTAQSLLDEAAAALPAFAALKEQTSVKLLDVVAEWMRAKQRQWDEKRLLQLLDGLEEQSEQKDDGGGGGGSGLLQRTVSTVVQLLTDYHTLRQSEEKVSLPITAQHQHSTPTRLPPLPSSLPSSSLPPDVRSVLCASAAYVGHGRVQLEPAASLPSLVLVNTVSCHSPLVP